jgi:competence protein ComEA
MNLPQLPEFTTQQRNGLAIVAVGAIALGVFYFFLGHGQTSSSLALPISSSTPKPKISDLASGMEMPISSTSPTQLPEVVVDVAGKVKSPGVYSLPAGSRAIDALKAAGDALKGVDLSNLNLAELLVDGQQLIVGQVVRNSALSIVKKTSGKASAKTLTGPVHLNSATVAELDSLPGIGPVMANRILQYRKKNGLFTSIADLRKVAGMGKAKYEELKSLVRL